MKAFRVLESILAIGVTGLLWALGCLGIITIGPSTAAMFAVFTAWEPGQEPPPVWTTFWSKFRAHFRQSVGIGLALLLVIAVLLMDAWYAIAAQDAPIRPVVFAAAIFGGVLVMGTMVFLFPVLVSYPSGWRRVVRNAALFAAGYVWTTLRGLFVWALAIVAIYWSLVLAPFAIGFAAFFVSRLTGRAFERYLVHQAVSQAATSQDDTPTVDVEHSPHPTGAVGNDASENRTSDPQRGRFDSVD